jgi:hypothetical protein
MTAGEQAQMRDVIARNQLLEEENEHLRELFRKSCERRRRQNRRLRALLKAQCTRRQKALDTARYLHGVLLANGIEVQR